MMDFASEMNEAISLGLDGFKDFIQKKLSTDKSYLEHFFWLQEGSQVTVLNYLIQVHQDKNGSSELNDSDKDLTAYIDYVLDLSKDKNLGEPLHQVIVSGHFKLAFHLMQVTYKPTEQNTKSNVINLLLQEKEKLRVNRFDLDRRDSEGRTLLSLILNSKLIKLLINLLAGQPNIHATTSMSDERVKFQPIHQAVELNFGDGVRLLGHEGAQLDNPVGDMKDTPLILAARLGKINALEALLEFPVERLMFEADNNNFSPEKKNGHTAMEELCERIAGNNEKEEAIRGIAMLLCRGAEPPESEEMRQSLCSNRIALLKAIHNYLEDKPGLVDTFVNRCHLRESALHNIVYADHSWGSSIRHLFGTPSEAAFIVENLVTRKYDCPQADKPTAVPLSSTTAENLLKETNPLKLYAEFVRRYTQAYESQLIPNRWSTMRWMIAEGNCDWATVVNYARNHPTSRTRIIYNEMFHPIPKVNEDMEEKVSENTAKASL